MTTSDFFISDSSTLIHSTPVTVWGRSSSK
jgi:hypothetical protein